MTNYYIKGASEKWVRPAGWLAMPNIQPTDNHIAILYAVFENEVNIATISAVVVSGGSIYNIDWGDGTNVNVSNAATQSRQYTYSTISSPILQDKNGNNYKQVLIQITMVSGTVVNGWNLGPSISNNSKNNTLEIVYAWNLFGGTLLNPGEFSGIVRRAIICESIRIIKGSISSSGTGTGRLQDLLSLNNFDISGLTFIDINVANMFTRIGAWNGGDLTIGGTATPLRSILGCFSNNTFKKIGNINTPFVTNHSSIFQAAIMLEEVGNINATSTTTMASIFQSCFKLRKIGTITVTTALTSISAAFQQCYLLEEIVFSGDMGNCTTPASVPFQLNTSLRVLRLPNIKHTLLIQNTSMSRAAIVDLFNDLGTVPSSTETINVAGSVGTPYLTAGDIAIATGKGWLVVY